MKKRLLVLMVIVLCVAAAIFFLQIEVTTQQGIDYQVHAVKMPLYLKILDFMDRHYNYKHLVQGIFEDEKDEQAKVMKLFHWTYENIRKQPEELPVFDDHVWHIIIRGYGNADQSCDVFSTLCNYAGVEAFFSWVYASDNTRIIPLSYVNIKGKWNIFDPYNGSYFKDENGELADIETIKSDRLWVVENLNERSEVNYSDYFHNLPSIKDIGLTRSKIQTPLNRARYEIQKKKK